MRVDPSKLEALFAPQAPRTARGARGDSAGSFAALHEAALTSAKRSAAATQEVAPHALFALTPSTSVAAATTPATRTADTGSTATGTGTTTTSAGATPTTATTPVASSGSTQAPTGAAAKTPSTTATSETTTTTAKPANETTKPVPGRGYAEITGGPRNGMFVNTSGNVRDGEAFVMVKRNGRQFHIYGTGEERRVFEVHAKPKTAATITTPPAASATQPASGTGSAVITS